MKILLLHPHDIFDSREPWTIRIESLGREFVRMGHDVKLIHCIHETSVERLTIHPYGFSVISLRRRGGWRLFTENLWEILTEIRWADVVHFQKCFHYISLPTLIGCLLYGKPVHYDWDDLEEAIYRASAHPPNRMIEFFLHSFETIVPKIVDSISVSSRELKQQCCALGVPETHIVDAPVGADLKKFGAHVLGDSVRKRFHIPGKAVLYIGQLNGAQYTKLFIEAVGIVKKAHPDTRYIIVGSGDKLLALKKLAVHFGVSDVIYFVGAVRHDLVPQYIAASDIAVACFEDNEITRSKSPLKVVEYMAGGRAIVASAVGEVKTMLQGCGVLVRPGDSAALAKGILGLLENDARRMTLGRLARQRAREKYNWPTVASTIMQAYRVNETLKEGKPRRPVVSTEYIPIQQVPEGELLYE